MTTAALILLGCGAAETVDSNADTAITSTPEPSTDPTKFPSTASTGAPTPSANTSTAESVASPATTSTPSSAATTSTTQWTPPSITWPTTPDTLPPDYGAGVTCNNNTAPPRATYPLDAALPGMEWSVDGALTIRFDPPDNFQQDPLPRPAVGDCDRANGLYLLERWFLAEEPGFAGVSVQANPGDESPLLSRTEFADTVVGSNVTWYLWNGETVRQAGKPPNMGLAVAGDYLVMVHGTPDAMRAIVENLTIEITP